MRFADLLFILKGSTSGEQIIKAAAAASGAITLPAGTTDFTSTGGASQVVRQSTAGGPFTVGQLAAADVTGAITGNQTITLSGDITGSGTTAITTNLAAGSVTLADMQNRAASTLFGNPTGSAAAPSEITLGTNLSFAGTVLNAAGGGSTGLSGMTAGQIPIAATATTVTSSANLSGDVVSTATTLATTIQANAVTTTKILNASVTYAKIQNVTNNRILGNTSGSAAAPAEIVLPLAVANGGTGLASGTSGGIPYFSATGTLASSALLTANALIKGGGSGSPPVASTATVDGSGNLAVTGYVTSDSYTCRAGEGGTVRANQFNIDWTGNPEIWIDATKIGVITIASDYRIKENVTELPGMWDQVKALRPISYTRKDNAELLSVADPAERWGFIAHELQEELIPTAATGYKDAANEVQSPDVMTLLAVTTKALQEVMVRIEALEARTPPPG
jgi:hypothetical protein